MRAKVANEPAICVSARRVTFNAWNRRFTVDLSGTRPRHPKSEFLSIYAGSDKVVPGGNAKAAFAKMSARSNLVSIVNVGDDMNHNTDAFSSFYATLQFFRKQP